MERIFFFSSSRRVMTGDWGVIVICLLLDTIANMIGE